MHLHVQYNTCINYSTPNKYGDIIRAGHYAIVLFESIDQWKGQEPIAWVLKETRGTKEDRCPIVYHITEGERSGGDIVGLEMNHVESLYRP